MVKECSTCGLSLNTVIEFVGNKIAAVVINFPPPKSHVQKEICKNFCYDTLSFCTNDTF